MTLRAEHLATRLVDRLARVEGPVVSDDAGFLLRAGKPLLFRPFVMTQLPIAGL